MQGKFRQLLHQYKLDAFRVEHNQKDVGELTRECVHICDEVLKQKYEYHFHKLPDANRAEIINMINNYTREAILPPVIERLVHRQVVLERHVAAIESLVEKLLDTLSQEPQTSEAVTS